jgi:gp16 family phage-associated protein
MHPEQIKAEIRMKGTTPSAIADELGVSRTTVSQVISGKGVSHRISAHIAAVIGLPVSTLWPTTTKRHVLRRKSSAKLGATA